jgi:hypothetical protein
MKLLNAITNDEIDFSLYILFIILFVYTVTAAILLQVIILPNYFPSWVNEFGMLKQTDSILYHEWAVELSNNINKYGWSNWELAPSDKRHFIVGLSSIFYTLIYPEPWVMIPANSFVHALSGIMLVRIAFFFTKDWRIACLAMVPYVFYPSASMWFSQLLKDGYFNLGIILFCYGWMLISHENVTTRKAANIYMPLFYILVGYLLMGIVRPYAFYVMRVEAIIFTILISSFYIYKCLQKYIDYKELSKKIILCFICIALLKFVSILMIHTGITDQKHMEYSALAVTTSKLGKINVVDDNLAKQQWVSTDWIPKLLDSKLETISGMRKAFIYNYFQYGRGQSAIDTHVLFNNVVDVFAYIPRATQIGFLAPFPDIWFGEGSTKSTSVMRKVSMFEMIAIYIAIIFLPFALWKWKMRLEMWVAFTYCYSMLLLFSLSFPNVGTLYRYRYAFLMIIITILLVYALDLFKNVAKAKNNKTYINSLE